MGVYVFYRKQGFWTVNLIALPCNDRNMTWANVWNVLDHHDADFVDPIDGMCPWQSDTLKILLFNVHTGTVDENKRGLFKSSIEFNYCGYFQVKRK